MDIDYYELYKNQADANSGENTLAIVTVFDMTKTVVYWKGDVSSIVVHDSLENFKKVSLSGDRILVRERCHSSETSFIKSSGEEEIKRT